MKVLAILLLSVSLALATVSKSERESFPIKDKASERGADLPDSPSQRDVIGLGNYLFKKVRFKKQRILF